MSREISLTREQKQAIRLMPEHNVQLIACAGSGKTEIISRGVVAMLEKGVKPAEIVAFTFTEKAAEELKARIRRILQKKRPGKADIGDMYVGTIHSYCFETLKELEPSYRGYDVLDEASRVAYLSKPYTYWNSLKLNKLQELWGIKRYTTITRFIDSVDIVLNENIAFSRLRRAEPDLASSIDAYRGILQTDHYLDFSTMIHELVSLLERKKTVRRQLHDRVRYVVVDEYQDINGLQERLIMQMAGPRTHITVVGDDDQSIYGWRGAVVDYIINFSKRFPDVRTVRLERNFRSTKGIIPLANDYIGSNVDRLEKSMIPVEGKRSKYLRQDIQYYHFKDEDEQAGFIAGKIRELEGADFLEKDGTSYGLTLGDMAIIVRANADIRKLLPQLEAAGIDYVVDSGETVFDRPIVEITHRFLDYIFALGDAQLETLVDQFQDYLKKKKHRQIRKKDLITVISQLRTALDKVARRGKKDYLPDLGLQGIFHELLEAMGIARLVLSEPEHYYLATFSNAISDYEKVWQRLRHREYKYFRGFITAWGQRSYAVNAQADISSINAVKVMTIHKAKGLEFPVVILPYLNRKQKRRKTLSFIPEELFDAERYQGDEEDERRVYYVAMTRSEKYLFLSGMSDDPDVKNPRMPATVVAELDRSYLQAPKPLRLRKSGLAPRETGLHEFTTTFSDLASYGRCGYDYKLRHIYGYNAGVPVAFGYGTQIHNILNIIHTRYRDKPISGREIKELLDKNFHLRYAPGNITENMRKAALNVVRNYVRDHSKDFGKVLETEKSFEFTLGNTLITGQIDLINRLDDTGHLREVELVDFKSDTALLYKVDNEHQLRLYVMASEKALGLTAGRACIHDLESGQRKYVGIDMKALSETEAELQGRIQGICRGDFRPPASRKELCLECDYGRICMHRKLT